MILLRRRNHELDKFRSIDPGYNFAWLMFFGTKPPGIHPAGVSFTEDERQALADGLPFPAHGSRFVEVESYDPDIHNDRGVGRVHGRWEEKIAPDRDV